MVKGLNFLISTCLLTWTEAYAINSKHFLGNDEGHEHRGG